VILDASPLIRAANIADLSAIAEIEQLSFVHAGERFGLAKVHFLIRSPRAIALVSESKDRVTGWAAGFTWTQGKLPWGRVYALAIHPESRGRKLGELLLRHEIDVLRQGGARTIFLEVRPDNETARKLYEKFGFVECGTLPHFYGRGLPARRMKLEYETRS
jgi:[ribosomal protein S18]-alanine N-acetyltransferase